MSDLIHSNIPVIDLFAGPGGLGEGFASFRYRKQPVFNVCLSIEKDFNAYRTLRLRSFFRKISFPDIKSSYIHFAQSSRSEKDELELYSKFESTRTLVEKEVLWRELGGSGFSQEETDKAINEKIRDSKLWVLMGGPPCQAYSMVGRARMSEIRKRDIEFFESDERHYLYKRYLRIISVHKPPIFVMENVKGILTSKIKGQSIFKQILRDLERPDGEELKYNLYSFTSELGNNEKYGSANQGDDYLIKAEEYGIPQTRHRVIIIGVKSDIDSIPEALKPRGRQISLKDIITDLPEIRSDVTPHKNGNKAWDAHIRDILKKIDLRKVNKDLRKIMRLYMTLLEQNLPTGGEFLSYLPGRPNKIVKSWYRKDDIGGVCNHESKYHMPEDLQRYFFFSCFALFNYKRGINKSPNLKDFPETLLPKHENIKREAIKDTIFDDRFRVQLWNSPATTITSHIAKDGHYYIHPDPGQCRSLSVREAARIQTFPDSYIFLGPKTAQYQQVGNAVPPLLARQLAKIVFKIISTELAKNRRYDRQDRKAKKKLEYVPN
jgi:DNA (cytosine-5)-methyltransferase 1